MAILVTGYIGHLMIHSADDPPPIVRQDTSLLVKQRYLPGRSMVRGPLTACALALLLLLPVTGGRALGAAGDFLVVGAGGAVLRTAPDAGATALGHLDAGTRVVEFARRGAWLRVKRARSPDGEGWVAAAALQPVEPARQVAPPPAKPTPEEAWATAPLPTPFRLELRGSPALEARIDCLLVAAGGGERRYQERRRVPERLDFPAAAVDCLVQKWQTRGRLIVRLFGPEGLLAEAETAAPFNFVRVLSAGPWGGAAGLRGALPQRLPRALQEGSEPPSLRLRP